MPRPKSKEGAEKKRQAIVAAALTCFRRNGFHKTGMQEICRTAELSPGTVYYYFKSKDEIIEHIAAREVDRTREFADYLRSTPSLEKGLIDAVDHILASQEYNDDFQVFMEVVCEAGRNEKVAELLLASDEIALSAIREKLEDEQKSLRGTSTDALAAYLGGQLEFLEMFKRYNPSPKECKEIGVVCRKVIRDLLA